MSLVHVTNVDDAAANVMEGRECSWSAENDARRPATKQLVEGLHTKIQMLEAEVVHLKGRLAISVEGDHEYLPLSNNELVFPPDQVESSTSERERPEPPSVHIVVTATYRYIFDIDTNIPASDQPKDVHLSLVCQWDRHLPQVPHFTRLEHDTILSRCFKYGVTWLHFMLPETFLRDMLYSLTSEPPVVGNQLRLQHYTPMLHCALLAYASAFSDNPEIRSPPFRARFAQYAKQWLDFEFERPTMGLVGALALLAEYHCGIGERGAGYMYMGMSIRAARSLILRDGELGVNEGASVLPELVERDWHFWSAFCQGQVQTPRHVLNETDPWWGYSADKIMALEFKQQYDLPPPHLGVSFPSVDTELDNQPWSDGLAGFPPRLITKTFFESCKLMVISSRVVEVLYDKYQVTNDERSVINIHLQLDTWFNNLPRELLVWARSTSPLPHIIALHLCYWFLIICLHQPYYHRPPSAVDDKGQAPNTASEISGQSGSGDRIHDLSIKMVDRATHKIVQLIQMFEEQHGMMYFPRNMVHVIYECGTVLLKEAGSVPSAATKKRTTALEAASACLRALRGSSRTWPWAEQLASQLEGNLNEAGANIIAKPFVSDWFTPWGDQMGQTSYPLIQVWDPSRSDPANPASGMQTRPSRGVSSTDLLGLEISQSQHQAFGNPAIGVSLGETTRSADITDTETGVYDAISFSGTPSSSTGSYSLPQQGANEDIWDHRSYREG